MNTVSQKQSNTKKKVPQKRKSKDAALETAPLDKRPKRSTKKPVRYGKRISAINRNAFFEQFNSNDTQQSNEDDSTSNALDDSDASHNSNDDIDSSHSSIQLSNNSMLNVHNSSHDSEHILHESSNNSTADLPQLNDNLEAHSPQSNIGHSTFHSTVITKLDEILKRISYIEKDSCKTQARLSKLDRNFDRYLERLNGNGIDVMEAVSETDREIFGVPISSKIALDKFEKDLSSSDFKSKLVMFVVL